MYHVNSFSDGLWAYAAGVAVFAAVLLLAKSEWLKRFISRFAVNLRAKCSLDEQHYHEFRDVDVVCPMMGHKHIDYVYVSRYGIFVVATPNQQGRIEGRAGSERWRQKLYKSVTDFPNPLLQNQHYIRALAEKLALPQQFFFSVVVFSNSRFRTMMPDNVVEAADFEEYIAQYDEILLTDLEVAQVKAVLDTNEFDVVFSKTGLNTLAL